jgi:putative peptidoglycan lipid II flippase
MTLPTDRERIGQLGSGRRLTALLRKISSDVEPVDFRTLSAVRPEQAGHSRVRRLLVREFSITEGVVLLMASIVFSALLGSVRQVLLNAQFGTGMAANAYYAAFRLPDGLFALIAGGALSSAMIPILLSIEREDGPADWARLVNLVFTSLMVVLIVIVALGEIFAPAFVHHLLAPGFDAETSQLTIRLTRIMLLQPLILAAGSVAAAVLNSRNQFLLTAISYASHNVCIILGIAATWVMPGLGIYGPTLGLLAGAALQVVILLPGIHDNGLHFSIDWDPASERLRQVVRLLIPNGLSVGVGYTGFIVDTAFASKVPNNAALPAIQNAWLLVALPIAFLGSGIGQAVFPRLAAHAAAARWRTMRRTLLSALAVVLILAIPALLGLAVLGRFLIHILFEHGKFDAAAGSLAYRVLLVYVLALPAAVATEILTRGLIALRDTRTPLLTNSLQLVLRVALIALLLNRLDVVAIPLAFTLSASLETLLLAAILLPRVAGKMRKAGVGAE